MNKFLSLFLNINKFLYINILIYISAMSEIIKLN